MNTQQLLALDREGQRDFSRIRLHQVNLRGMMLDHVCSCPPTPTRVFRPFWFGSKGVPN